MAKAERGTAASSLPRSEANLAKAASKGGKLDPVITIQPHQLPDSQPTPSQCPECGSKRVYKDGIRATRFGPHQRYLCRDCGYRFSRSPSTRDSLKPLNLPSAHTNTRQVCDDRKRALSTGQVLKLALETRNESSRESTTLTPDQATVKGLLVKFAAHVEREGYAPTDNYLTYLTILVKHGADLLDPDSVKTVIAQLKKKDGTPCKNGTKMLMVQAYKVFAEMLNIKWKPPRYHQEEIIPFVPDEVELDQLIGACRSKRMTAFLQTLKETFADPSEVLKIRWIDVDFEHRIIAINHPVKGHLPGQIEVSNRLLSMLNNLPKTSEYIFPTYYETMHDVFQRTRQRIAHNLQNPRLLKITFTSFRHWGGTKIAHDTNGNVLTVKKLLRHKVVASTMKYIGMIHFKDDEFEIATATTDDEIKQLGVAGFKKYDEHNGIHFYRRPKRFKC